MKMIKENARAYKKPLVTYCTSKRVQVIGETRLERGEQPRRNICKSKSKKCRALEQETNIDCGREKSNVETVKKEAFDP